LLLLTFAVTGVISWIGQTDDANHEETYDNGLLTSAAFAASAYSERLSGGVHSVVLATFRNITTTATSETPVDDLPNANLDVLQALAHKCDCTPSEQLVFNYKYDFNTSKLQVDQAITDSDSGRELQPHCRASCRAQPALDYSVAVGPDASHPVLISLVRKDSATSKSIYAIGFGARTKLLETATIPVDSFNLELPRPAHAEPLTDRFAITLLAGQDTLLNVGESSEYSVTYNLVPGQGNIAVIASVNKQRFTVVAGAAPISRAPVYVGLLMLVGILITASLVLAKRQGQLAEARTDFVSNVSHELRTPLAQIRMFAETLLLGRARNDTERRRSLEIIDQEARRLNALVDNVLQLGRAERGVAHVAPTEIALGPAVREAVDRFAQLPRSKNVDFRTEVENRLVAMVDPNALRQIVDNLLDNAVKYGPSGQRVNVGLAMFEQNARLWVDDEGPGIPLRERDRVFEPFFRSTLHSQSSTAGSGIGLAVVRELTDLLEGRVWAETAPGGGARIVVEFPNAYLQPEEAAGGWAVA
jgi:signal transduction histidine kinase